MSRVDEGGRLGRTLQVRGVTGPGNQCEGAARHVRRNRHSLTCELLVEGPRQCESVDRAVRELFAEPGLRPGAGVAQGLGESVRVAAARGTFTRVGCQRREERLGQPLIEEAFGANLLDAISQALVARNAARSLNRILDAASRAEQDQSGQSVRVAKGKVQCHSRAKGVAPENEWLLRQGVRQQLGAFIERCAQWRVVTVTGQVDSEHLVGSCQNGTKLVRRLAGLREAVQPYKERTRAVALDTEE